jgi:YVTN family beta-propeller protein
MSFRPIVYTIEDTMLNITFIPALSTLSRVAAGALFASAMSQYPSSTALAQATPSYRITKTIALGAPDRWDYLTFDAASDRVFVAHGDQVTVVDGREGTVIGNVGGFPGGTHGVAIVADMGRGYSDDGKAGTATSFDLKLLRPLRTTKAGIDADGIVFDPFSRHVFVINGDSGSVTAIDPARETVAATIKVGGGLEFGVVDAQGKLYVNGAERQEVVRIDTNTNRVDARWPIPNCTRPHGIAIDSLTHRVFATCVNNIMVVIDTDTGATIATLPIGSRSDAAVFDAKRKLAFSSNGDGTLTVVAEQGPNQFVVLGNVPTALGARTMALNPDSGRIYLVTADFTVNDKASAADARHRYVVTPGTMHMLFLDPVP